MKKIFLLAFYVFCNIVVAQTNSFQSAKFDDFINRFNNTNSTNSTFNGIISPYPSNPQESFYKKDFYNNKLIYEGYVVQIVTGNYGNSVYKEEFKHGKGKEYFSNTNGYLEGYFIKNKLNGYGIHLSDGYSYKGYFVNGEKNGEGILVSDGLNGTTKYIYEGNFTNNKFNGKGLLIYEFMAFIGEFVNGEMYNGTAFYPNNTKYIGHFVNGNYDGYGEYFWSNGNVYKGNFKHGKFNGSGILTYSNGNIQNGVFENGNYIGEEKRQVVKNEIKENKNYIGEEQQNVSSSSNNNLNYTKQVLNAYNQLSDFANKNGISLSDESKTSSQSTGKSFGKSQCNSCRPKNSKGWYIQDFNSNTRTYKNGRYILKPGYKSCESCQGTGNCKVRCSRGKTDCPGICEDDDTCSKCNGDRFVVCNSCKGKG
jgi:hypothetical protein